MAGAVAKRIEIHIHPIEQRKPEVVERRFVVVTNVAARLQRSSTLAGDENWQVVVVVGIAVGVAAAVGNHAMIEQRSVSFFDALHLVQQVCQLRRVELVDLANLGLLGFIVAVMRKIVMPFRNIDERIGFYCFPRSPAQTC